MKTADKASRTNNYFICPSRVAKKRLVEVDEEDPRVGSILEVGEGKFQVLGRYEVSQYLRAWKTISSKTVTTIPPGVVYLKVRAVDGDAISIVKGTAGKTDDGVPALRSLELLQEDGKEWIGVKVAKLLEQPNQPKDFDWTRVFFFDDQDPASTLKAYEGAKRLDSNPVVYRSIGINGPWGGLATVCQDVGSLSMEPN